MKTWTVSPILVLALAAGMVLSAGAASLSDPAEMHPDSVDLLQVPVAESNSQ